MYIAAALILLLLKAGLVVVLGIAVRRALRLDVWGALLAGWLTVQAIQLFGMVALSLPATMAPASYRLWIASVILACLLLAVRIRPLSLRRLAENARRPANWGPLLFCAATTGLLLIRALFFFDTVHDSQNIYLTRLAYLFQHRSIFAHGPSLARMFCYEWNAQLNGLHYQLLAGTDRAVALAGVETWWVSIVAMVGFARALGACVTRSFWCAVLIGTTPLVFNLVGVTKGDVLAMAALVGALACTIRMRAGDWRYQFVLAVMLVTYGAGCKSTLAPVLAIFAVVSLLWLFVGRPAAPRFPRWPVTITAFAMTPLFLARYLANLIAFHNPLQRGPGEVVRFEWENLALSLQSQFHYLFGVTPDTRISITPQYHAALTWGFAFTGWLLLLACAMATGQRLVSQRSLATRTRSGDKLAGGAFLRWFALGLTIVWLFLSGLFPIVQCPGFYTWLLRFFLPFLVPPALVVLATLAPSLPTAFRRLFAFVACLGAALNLQLGFCPSDIMAVKGLRRVPYVMTHYDHFASKLADEYGGGWRRDLGSLASCRGQCQRILLYHQPDTVVYPLFGENLEWHVDLTDSQAHLAEQLQRSCYDWVAMSRHDRNESWLAESETIVESAKYVLDSDGKWWRLYKRVH